jgi:hypothetical protein
VVRAATAEPWTRKRITFYLSVSQKSILPCNYSPRRIRSGRMLETALRMCCAQRYGLAWSDRHALEWGKEPKDHLRLFAEPRAVISFVVDVSNACVLLVNRSPRLNLGT